MSNITRTRKTAAACSHGDAEAVEFAVCGQQQEWKCDGTDDDCGEYYVITKPHHVSRYTLHAAGCDRQNLPASWCGCEARQSAACMDCGEDFPNDVKSDFTTVIVFD